MVRQRSILVVQNVRIRSRVTRMDGGIVVECPAAGVDRHVAVETDRRIGAGVTNTKGRRGASEPAQLVRHNDRVTGTVAVVVRTERAERIDVSGDFARWVTCAGAVYLVHAVYSGHI